MYSCHNIEASCQADLAKPDQKSILYVYITPVS